MLSQADRLEKMLKELELELGPDAIMLGHLRTQIASLRKQEQQRAGATPAENPVSFQIGMLPKPSTSPAPVAPPQDPGEVF